LRRNGGGDSRLGDELLSHLTSTPYRYSARKEWKMSAEYRSYLRGAIKQPYSALRVEMLHPMGRQLFGGPDGKTVVFADEPHPIGRHTPAFDGPVCFIIGPGTFSSAVDLSDAVKTYHLGMLVGEETGGRPNSFGEIYEFRTPVTGFYASVSTALFVRANGDTTDHRGVLPDIEVRRSTTDIAAGRDPVLERAMQCSR
jgi:hypothetical protein